MRHKGSLHFSLLFLLIVFSISGFSIISENEVEEDTSTYITVEQREWEGSHRGVWRKVIIRSYDYGPWVVISSYGEHIGELSRVHRGLDPDEFREVQYKRIAKRRTR